jgi:hypothetical protein
MLNSLRAGKLGCPYLALTPDQLYWLIPTCPNVHELFPRANHSRQNGVGA